MCESQVAEHIIIKGAQRANPSCWSQFHSLWWGYYGNEYQIIKLKIRKKEENEVS